MGVNNLIFKEKYCKSNLHYHQILSFSSVLVLPESIFLLRICFIVHFTFLALIQIQNSNRTFTVGMFVVFQFISMQNKPAIVPGLKISAEK